MILASLVSRPVRTLVSVFAVALEVTMILVIVGLTNGITEESARRILGVGGDFTVRAPNSSALLALSASTMPVAIGDKILSDIKGVRAVAPVLVQMNAQNGLDLVYGIDPVSFEAVGGPFEWHKGRMFSEPGDIVVDDIYATSRQLDVGSKVEVLNHSFTVSGIVENGRGSRLFIPLTQAQEMVGVVNRATIFFVRTASEQDVPSVQVALEDMLQGYQITPARELMSQLTPDKVPGLDAFLRTVVFIAVCVGVLVIFLSMYTTITERTREIGILRSLGASKFYVMRLFFQESIVLCVIGVGIGLITSQVVKIAIINIEPTVSILISNDWILKASASAVLSGVIGSFYPSLKAAKLDPIDALAHD